MKNTKRNIGLRGVLALTTLLAALFVHSNALAADMHSAKGGATQLRDLKTVSDIEAVKPGDVVVMACPKCKTITETRVTMEPKGGPTETKVAVHECPGCGAKWETEGHGKAKTEKVTHVCTHCGSKAAWCAVKQSPDSK